MGVSKRARTRQFWIALTAPVYNTLTPFCDGSIVAELAQTQCSGSMVLKKISSFHSPAGIEVFFKNRNPRHVRHQLLNQANLCVTLYHWRCCKSEDLAFLERSSEVSAVNSGGASRYYVSSFPSRYVFLIDVLRNSNPSGD